jgi:hypothetical protein
MHQDPRAAESQYAVCTPGAPAPAEAAALRRLAVFVTHGMGQQVPFATLDAIFERLRRLEPFASARPEAAGDRRAGRHERRRRHGERRPRAAREHPARMARRRPLLRPDHDAEHLPRHRHPVRPERWVNIYSSWDIIRGSLEFFDLPDSSDRRWVMNRRDRHATTLLMSHVEYWENAMLPEVLSEALTGPMPA